MTVQQEVALEAGAALSVVVGAGFAGQLAGQALERRGSVGVVGWAAVGCALESDGVVVVGWVGAGAALVRVALRAGSALALADDAGAGGADEEIYRARVVALVIVEVG